MKCSYENSAFFIINGSGEGAIDFDVPLKFDKYSLFTLRNVNVDTSVFNVHTYNVKATGNYTVELVFNIFAEFPIDCEVFLYKNDRAILNVKSPEVFPQDTLTYSGELFRGDYIYVGIIQDAGLTRVTECTLTVTEVITEFTALDLDFPIANNLPDIKQDVLIKEVLNLFCLIPFFDIHSNTITFEYFDKLYDNKNELNFYDFS
jgi:hypothetical protein